MQSNQENKTESCKDIGVLGHHLALHILYMERVALFHIGLLKERISKDIEQVAKNPEGFGFLSQDTVEEYVKYIINNPNDENVIDGKFTFLTKDELGITNGDTTATGKVDAVREVYILWHIALECCREMLDSLLGEGNRDDVIFASLNMDRKFVAMVAATTNYTAIGENRICELRGRMNNAGHHEAERREKDKIYLQALNAIPQGETFANRKGEISVESIARVLLKYFPPGAKKPVERTITRRLTESSGGLTTEEWKLLAETSQRPNVQIKKRLRVIFEVSTGESV